MRRAEALTKLRELLPEVRGRYGVKDLSLFGSIARDEANERQRHRCAGRLQWATNAAWIHGPQAVSSGCSRNTRRSRDPRSPQATNATTHRGGRRNWFAFRVESKPAKSFYVNLPSCAPLRRPKRFGPPTLLGLDHDTYGLAKTYLGAAAVLLVLYPLCVVYRRYKAGRPDGWTRYV